MPENDPDGVSDKPSRHDETIRRSDQDPQLEHSMRDYHRARQDRGTAGGDDRMKEAEGEVARRAIQTSDRLKRGRPPS
jgi:hypothetical protein